MNFQTTDISDVILTHPDYPYLRVLGDCLIGGKLTESRNGKTFPIASPQIRFDLSKGFPLLVSKTVNWKLVLAELFWFLEGGLNPKGQEIKGRMSFKRLEEIYGKKITQMWVGDFENFADTGKAQFDGDLGRIYGSQWRSYPNLKGGYIDQIVDLIQGIKTDPYSRRHLVNAWNVAELDDMALPPCHYSFQCIVSEGCLDIVVNMRSGDIFLGVPFNIASYAALNHLLCRFTKLKPGEVVLNVADCHLYDRHKTQVVEQLTGVSEALDSGIEIEHPTFEVDSKNQTFEQLLQALKEGLPIDEICRVDNYEPHKGVIKADVLTGNVL